MNFKKIKNCDYPLELGHPKSTKTFAKVRPEQGVKKRKS